MVHFAKNSNLYSIDFLHFFAKSRKSVEEVIHQKKNRGHRTTKSWKNYINRHLPYLCSFYYLARALVHDVACEFTRAVEMRANVLKAIPQDCIAHSYCA